MKHRFLRIRICLARLSLAALGLSFCPQLACLAAQERKPNEPQQDRPVLIDFQDTELKTVITALAEAGALNVTFGDLPPRRITLRMRQPVPRADIKALLRSLAQSNGLVVNEDAGVLRFDVPRAGDAATQDTARGSREAEARLYVHRLRHAQAAKLATTLQAIFGGGLRTDAGTIRRRPLSDQLRETRLQPLGADTVRANNTAPGIPGQLRSEVQIVPDEATNSLLVRAIPDDWTVLLQAIEAMDLRPLQVLIEVLIAEVRTTSGLETGVKAKAERRANGNVTSGELASTSPTDFILKLTRGGRISMDVALGALESRGKVRVLSRPLLLAQNNLEAKILVGSQRPFVQVSRSLPTDLAVRDQIVQYRDVGTSLTILPTINPDDYVNLQVVQEVSTATDETQFGAPVISTREATTRLFVKNGQTAVLGGLVDHQQDRSRSGIPVLSAIPLVGGIFGSTKSTTTTSELFLFLTPYLVRSDEELEQLRLRLERESAELEATKALDKRRPLPTVRPDTLLRQPRR